ncbi:thioredoxin family protein [Streptomyces sp. NPDC001665]
MTDSLFPERVLDAQGSVLVQFWAEWSGPSRMMAAELEKVAPDYAGRLTVAALNIEHNPETALRYDIKAIPSLLLFKNGAVEGTRGGELSRAQLTEFLDAEPLPGKQSPARQGADFHTSHVQQIPQADNGPPQVLSTCLFCTSAAGCCPAD